jgi:hypothetical protein
LFEPEYAAEEEEDNPVMKGADHESPEQNPKSQIMKRIEPEDEIGGTQNPRANRP